MCIIVAKPEGVKMPSYETLETCFENNPDGAGFMYADGKTVRIRKGFMTFDDFVDAVNMEFADIDASEYSVVMHFRIQTSGDVVPECTHPFPVTSDEKMMRKLSLDSRWGIAHNGVIHGMSTKRGWSDTMDFVASVVAPMSRLNANFVRNDDALAILKKACGSKLCILENCGEIATVGEFTEVDGVLYSNGTYAKRKSNWSSYSSFWDDNYDDYYGGYKANGFRLSGSDVNGLMGEYEITEDDMENLIGDLAFDACAFCGRARSCALIGEECYNDAMAIDICAEENGMKPDEIASLLYGDMEDGFMSGQGELVFED